MNEIEIKLSHDELKSAIKLMLAGSDLKSLAELGEKLGYKQTTFRSSITNNSMRFRDFVRAAEVMGYDVIIQKK